MPVALDTGANDFTDDDWRKTNPRFTGENFQRNLSAPQLDRLNNLTPAAGERHDEANMATIDR